MNSSLSVLSPCNFVLVYALWAAVHSYHNHLSLKTQPNLCKSRTPRPPRFFGLLTVGQLTRLCPPCAVSFPFQRKERRILSIFFFTHFAIRKIVRWYVGMEERTKLIRVVLPAFVKSFPFQPGNWAPIFSTSSCTCTLLNFLVCSVSPR